MNSSKNCIASLQSLVVLSPASKIEEISWLSWSVRVLLPEGVSEFFLHHLKLLLSFFQAAI